jgi:hypothetical protein
MINFLYYLLLICCSFSAYSSYELDFIIGESKNTIPLRHYLEIKEIDIVNETIDNPKPSLDEFGEILPYIPYKKGDTIAPGECFHFKLKNSNEDLNQESIVLQPSKITFKVLDDKKQEIEDVVLAWVYKGEKINFISDENKNFVFMPFQRNLPQRDRHTQFLKYNYELGLIDINN